MSTLRLRHVWLALFSLGLFSLGGLVAWAGTTCVSINPGTSTVLVRDEPHLLNLLEHRGSVRAIVRFRTSLAQSQAFVPEAQLSTTTQRATQRLAIAGSRQRILSQLSAFGTKAVREFDSIPFMAVELDQAGFAALKASPLVVSVQEDRLFAPTLAESIPRVGADIARSQGYSGAGQVVAILDTGVDAGHPFLTAYPLPTSKVVQEACFSSNTTDSTSLCPNGQNQEIGLGAATPCASGCDHGTHVAGIAAGNGEGIGRASGVAKDASIIAANIFSFFPTCGTSGAPAQTTAGAATQDETISTAAGCVLAWESDIIAGLQWVYGLASDPTAGIDIASVNMSLGGGPVGTIAECDSVGNLVIPGPNVAMKVAIDDLRLVDVATVIASGNNGSGVGISYPGCISSAISVGSTIDTSDAVSGFSNSASWLSLLAPGETITSSIPWGGYASWRGTSMATPHVAGAWAVMKSKIPSATVDEVIAGLTNSGIPIFDGRNGFITPRIQLNQALETFVPGTPLPINLTLDNDLVGEVVDGSFSGLVDTTAFGGRTLLSSGGGVDSFIFTPDIPQQGLFRLFAWWPIDVDSTEFARFDIQHSLGLSTIFVDQTVQGGQWNEFGIAQFQSGSNGYIKISDIGGGVAAADAIRLQYIGTEPPVAVEIGGQHLPAAGLNTAYEARLTASGAVLPLLWSIQGALPGGLQLDAATGVISGTPDEVGLFEFTIQLLDGLQRTQSRPASIRVFSFPPPGDVIIDNEDPEVSYFGSWTRKEETGTYGGTMHYGNAGQVNIARFTPDIPLSGQYRLYARWSASPNRSTQVAFDIQYANGLETVLVNQQINGSNWNELGIYSYSEGEPRVIEISDRNGVFAIADAIRLEFVGDVSIPLGVAVGSLPDALSGVAYQRFVTVGGGAPPYTWSLLAGGLLPEGLQLDPATGEINGVPSTVGQYIFTIQVQDVTLNTVSQEFVIDVLAPIPPEDDIILDNDDPQVSSTGSWIRYTESRSYKGSLHYGAPGRVNTFRFSPDIPFTGQYRLYARWSESPNRSTQVAFDIAHAGETDTVLVNQQVNGEQWNELGVYSFTIGGGQYVEVSDRNGIYAIADAVRFEYVGNDPIPLAFVTANLPAATVGLPYQQSVVVGGGALPYTWSLPVPQQLPSGLALASGTGIVSGVPDVAGQYSVTIQVQDANFNTVSHEFNIDVLDIPSQVADIIVDNDGTQVSSTGVWVRYIESRSYNGSLHYGAPGQTNTFRFSPEIPLSGYYRVFGRWSASPNRSPYVAFDIGHALGTDTILVNQQVNGEQWRELGVFFFTIGAGQYVEVSDRNGIYAIADAVKLQYVGDDSPPLAITTISLPGATAGVAYREPILVTGGVMPYSWSVAISQPLPSGLSLDPQTGIVSGIPDVTGQYSVAIQVLDANLSVVSQEFNLEVLLPLPPEEDIIVDNDSPHVSSTGSWIRYTESRSYNGSLHYGAPGQVNSFRFRPDIPFGGQYRVYGRWSASPNRSTQVAFDIRHAGGTDTVFVNQQANGEQWYDLGVYSYAIGDGQYVEVSDRNGIYAIADAIRLEYVP